MSIYGDSKREQEESARHEAEIEQDAHDTILKWCRSHPRGMGIPCMRNGRDGKCVIVDNSRFNSPRLFEGATWLEVLEAMRAKGVV